MATEPAQPTEPPDPEAEFSRLFWAARKEQLKLKDNLTADDEAHKAAIMFAQDRGWAWAESLLEASRLECRGEHEAALRRLAVVGPEVPEQWQSLVDFLNGSALIGKGRHDEAIDANRRALADPNFDSPGHALLNLGKALFDKGDIDEAIEAYRQVMADPDFAPPGKTWNNLGIALRAKGEYDQAIECYRNALDDPTYETPGKVWCNIGNALLAKGEYQEAIDAFHKALDVRALAPPGRAWHGLGAAHSSKGEYDQAIDAYRHALSDPKYDEPGLTWRNLALALEAKGDVEQAEKAYEEAIANTDAESGIHARARQGLELLQSKIDTESLSPDDRARQAPTTVVPETDQIEAGIDDAINKAGMTQYDRYRGDSDSGRDDTLSILRGWSSAVTLLEGSERRWRGGGYFLKWRGHGVVIDPGFDFLRNFHDAKYHGQEISAVLVSHNHPDHNSDVKAIDDLRYELCKRNKPTDGPSIKPYVLMWDKDTEHATTFGYGKPMHQHEPLALTEGYPAPFDLRDHPASIPIRVTPFNVEHGSDVPHAMGMVVELIDDAGETALRIGYTGDTEYFSDLHTHLKNCHILIAHISQPSSDELRDATELKEKHLGYRGTVKLLQECQPKLALIGEFWAGYADLRIPLVKGLRLRSGVKPTLPAGLGMHLRLPSMEIECTACGEPMPFDDVRIAPASDLFGDLGYHCPRCVIG